MKKEKSEKNKAEEKSNEMWERKISLVLNSYEDIFSDFDPREYTVKALSDDFLSECKKASIDKEEEMEIRIMVPAGKRNLKDEEKITERLKKHFIKHFEKLKEENRKIINRGLIWVPIGIVLILIATFISLNFPKNNFLAAFLVLLLEVAGWFLCWDGLDTIFYGRKELQPNFDFYRKMSKVKIHFLSY